MSLVIALGHAAAAQITLPVYIEDNHAGAFFRLAQHLDLDEPCTLLNFDAHSDVSAIFDSDHLREQLRRVGSVEERAALLDNWRRDGTIQSFNWIEPLMPLPFSKVIWIPPQGASAENEREAVEYLDGHLEAAPRRSGSFEGRFSVQSLEQLRAGFRDDGPLVISIDLDFFAGMEPKAQAAAFEQVWSFCCVRKNLRAVTFSISRPYLTGDEEAQRLVQWAIEAAASLPTAVIYFEPYLKIGHDASLKARELRRQNRPVPDYDVEHSPEELKAAILANRGRITVGHEPERWHTLLDRWSAECPEVRLDIPDHDPSIDGIWRVPANDHPTVRIDPWDAKPDRIEWALYVPCHPSCNLTATGKETAGFALDAPARPRWKRQVLPATGDTLPLDAPGGFFDPQTGTGSVRLAARVRFGKSIRETPVMEIRRFRGTGFQAGLTEQFGLPYLFGSGELRDGANTGPETGWGADCANFLIYAMRREGLRVPWSNPKQLRSFLEPVQMGASLNNIRITPEDVERGLVIHMGNHVAAVVEDRGTPGVLDGQDLVVHQLEGFPEILTLDRLLAGRHLQKFDLYRLPLPTGRETVLFGGDVMLARGTGEKIKRGENPFALLRETLGRASLRVVNLESVISDRGTASPSAHYAFRAPPESVSVLRNAGINAVGLANNHADDFGPEALHDCVSRLRQNGIVPLGTATQPYSIFQPGGKKIAILAVDALEDATAADSSGILNAADRERLAGLIAKAGSEADEVFCLVHWGQENTDRVTDEQRRLAGWLIDQGVDLVVGAHPHRVQPIEYYHGRPVAFSLGNMVFDGAPRVPGWSDGALLEAGIAPHRNLTLRTIPIHLDDSGFPEPSVKP